MSELLEGVVWTPPASVVREAAVVLLLRGREVFWVRRGARGFSAGYHAFPGGKVDAEDSRTPIVECPPGDEARRVAAIREVFEETGILLVPDAPPPEKLAALRAELLKGGSFEAIVRREAIRLDGSVLVPAGRWLTPDFLPVRYDTYFYLAHVPEGARGEVEPGELASGAFVRPQDALARWESGSALLHPPTHHALATLGSWPVEAAIPRLRAPPFVDGQHVARRMEFQRGVLMMPLRTPTLPPATHTNAYVVGTGELAVIDPGAADPAPLVSLLEELVAEGRRVKCVLLTHHHGDHVGGAAVIAGRFKVPVWASAGTAERVPVAEARLHEGEAIELDGPRPFRLRCLLTEGHARGHISFLDEATGAVMAGDMVASGSTIVIDPPEGDMGVYLASLRRLRELPAGTLYPAHGLPIAEGPAKLDEYLAHREARIDAIRASLPGDVPGIVERVYSDVPAMLHPVAERSALASLLELERRGQARRSGEGWAGV